MKPKILVLYYTQTGQLKQILDSMLSGIAQLAEIDYCEIKPVNPFPFPWQSATFFDCMPESVQQISEPIEPLHIPNKSYDLVILGYQPWFLSPSIPFNSFLRSSQADFLKGKKVITVIGSRNMWLNAQESVKKLLIGLKAELVGNIVFFDRNPNLTSVLTIIRWTFTGRKEATKRMPEAGVQQKDIDAGSRFGPILFDALQQGRLNELHTTLLSANAVEMSPALVILEKRAITNFRKFSLFILEKGKRGDPARKGRVNLFKRLLFVGVFILSPLSSLTAGIAVFLKKRSLDEAVQYFKNIRYKENAL
ncbi:MAG: hypothetical protein JNJ58_14100 [Chitinophagaceae bacterium]|nr:hypothetical protein [Chitinophagaceae bacterium]